MNRVVTRVRRVKQVGTVTGFSEDKSLMPSWRGQLSLVSVNAPAAGPMPLGPPQRMHGSRSAWRRSCPRGRLEWRIGVSVCCRLMWLTGRDRRYNYGYSLTVLGIIVKVLQLHYAGFPLPVYCQLNDWCCVAWSVERRLKSRMYTRHKFCSRLINTARPLRNFVNGVLDIYA